MIERHITSDDAAFLFSVLQLPRIVTKYINSTEGLYSIPEWCDLILECGYFSDKCMLHTSTKDACKYIATYNHSTVRSVDKVWLTLITWIIRENPTIETALNTIAMLAGESGFVLFVDTYLNNLLTK